MTWVWGLGPELLQVKRRLPAGRWGPVFRLTDPGKRAEVGLFCCLIRLGTTSLSTYWALRRLSCWCLDGVEEDKKEHGLLHNNYLGIPQETRLIRGLGRREEFHLPFLTPATSPSGVCM